MGHSSRHACCCCCLFTLKSWKSPRKCQSAFDSCGSYWRCPKKWARASPANFKPFRVLCRVPGLQSVQRLQRRGTAFSTSLGGGGSTPAYTASMLEPAPCPLPSLEPASDKSPAKPANLPEAKPQYNTWVPPWSAKYGRLFYADLLFFAWPPWSSSAVWRWLVTRHK